MKHYSVCVCEGVFLVVCEQNWIKWIALPSVGGLSRTKVCKVSLFLSLLTISSHLLLSADCDLPLTFLVLRLSVQFSSVQFSCSVVSDSLRPHESQHARPPCPSPTLGVHSNSCPSSRRCHLAISSSVVPFSSCPQSLPASESSPMSQLFA